MDTITYAAVVALPWGVAQQKKHPIASEPEFAPLDLSYLRATCS
jgi:hypothetical protein